MDLNNRKFSFVLAAFFLLIGWMVGKELWALVPAGVSVLFGLVYPTILTKPKAIFLRFSHWMGIVNSLVILTLIYFLLFTVFGLIGKLFGRNLITAKKDLSLNSYWKSKANVDYKEQMKYQF